MSQLKTNNITNVSNTGDPNIVLGDSGDVQVQSLNSGPLAGFRNQIVNGGFTVNQREASGTYTTSAGAQTIYTVDRLVMNQISNAVTLQSQLVNDLPGFTKGVHVNQTCGLKQRVELEWPGSRGLFAPNSVWTFSCWSTKPLQTGGFFFGVSPEVAASTAAVPTAGETIGPWTRYTYTATLNSVALTNEPCFGVVFTFPADTRTTGWQLERGPVATPFEHRPIGTELALCQRYMTVLDLGTNTNPVHWTFSRATDTGAPYGTVQFPTTMRVRPTFQEVGTVNAYATNMNFATTTSCSLTLNTSLSAHQNALQRCSANSNTFLKWYFDAEL